MMIVYICYMVVVKLSGSGNAVQFIVGKEDLEPGSVLQVSKYMLNNLLNGKQSGDFIVLFQRVICVFRLKCQPRIIWTATREARGRPGQWKLTVFLKKRSKITT